MKAKSKTLIEEKEKLKKFYVSYNEQSEITRERDPDDEWDGDDTSTMISFENAFIAWDGDTDGRKSTGRSVTSYADSSGYKDHYFRGMDIDWNIKFDAIYLIYARYDDGDTFHREEGRWAIVAAFSDKHKAESWMKENEESVKQEFSGYFEHFNSLDMDVLAFENYTV